MPSARQAVSWHVALALVAALGAWATELQPLEREAALFPTAPGPLRLLVSATLVACAVGLGSKWATFVANRAAASAVGKLSPWAFLSSPAAVVGYVVLAAASEEFVFRGVLAQWLGSWIAAAAFALAHAHGGRRSIVRLGGAFVMAWLMDGLFRLTGSLLAPVVAHATINTLSLDRQPRAIDPTQTPAGGLGGLLGERANDSTAPRSEIAR